MNDKKKYVNVQEIDGMTGIKSPHAREVETLGKDKINLLLTTKKRRVKIIVEERLKGKIENITFNENYTISFEFFPGVNAHVLFFNYEDEEDELFRGSELKFLFSGEYIRWIPSEDLISLLEVTFDYFEAILEDAQERYELPQNKSDLLQMAIQQRTEPFILLKPENLDSLARFIGGNIKQEGNRWELYKSFFQGIDIIIMYDQKNNHLDITYEGEHLTEINNYAKDQLGIFLLNHCLRFISISNPNIEMPNIVKQCFSFSYIKTHF